MKRSLFILLAIAASIGLHAQVSTTSDTTNTVFISYSGSSASIVICSNIESYVSATVSGTKVNIVQSSTVDSTTCGEIEYKLSGEAEGSFYMEGSYKASLQLAGLTLTNPSGPAIDIQNGKRIKMSIMHDSENTLTDGTSSTADAWKGALQCKGHMEIKGHGTLNVYGNYANAIWSKEYITVKNCTINVFSAVKDAINCNQYFSMESGLINLSGFADDGISVGLKNEDTSAENTGNFTMTGGTINIDTSVSSGKSINQKGTSSIAAEANLNTNWHVGIENTSCDSSSPQATKVQRNGHIYILMNHKKYTLLGSIIE